MKLIVLVVIVLAVIAVAQLMRVYELSSKLRGNREEDVDLKLNNMNAGGMLVFLAVFFGSLFWMLYLYGNGRQPEAASIHGQEVDWLFSINWLIIFAVFLGTNFLLFWFAYKYSYHPDRKAYYFPHDNKLELLWTIVPACVLAVIIVLGLMTWNSITSKPSDDAVVVELYAKQFDWTVRYAGEDNELGYADYKLVNGDNPLGVITPALVEGRLTEIDGIIADDQAKLDNFNSDNPEVAISAANEYKLTREIEKMGRIKQRIVVMDSSLTEEIYTKANDDFTSKSALFLIKDQEYFFVFRSRDVIHSAYFPHFRAQMNCVPGMRTSLKFTPIYTTEEMREKTQNPDFNYILMCNKICGASHSNMYLPVIVGTEEEFEAWKNDGVSTAPIGPVVEDAGDEGSIEIDVDPDVIDAMDGEDGADDAGDDDNGQG